MPKNPYFDDEDEDYSSEELENLDSPESYVAAQNQEEYPSWAQITSDLADDPPSGFEDVRETTDMAGKVVSNPILRPPRPEVPQEPVPVPIPVPVAEPSPSSPQATPQNIPEVEDPSSHENSAENLAGVPIPVPPRIEPRKTTSKPKMMPRDRTESSAEVPRSARYADEGEEELPRRRKPLRETGPSYSIEEDEDLEFDEEASAAPPRSRSRRKTGTRAAPIQEDFDNDLDLEEDEEEEGNKKKKNGGGLFAAWKKDAPKKKTSKQKSSKKSKESDSNNKYAGGRGRTLILRGIVWVVIVLVMFLGFRQVFFPPTPSIPLVAQQVATDLGITDFPETLGGSLALEFATYYLNFDPNSAEAITEREEQILSYLPSNADVEDFSLRRLFDIEGDTQQVIVDGPFLVERPVITGNSGFFVVAATIANVEEKTEGESTVENFVNEKRIYLTVPIVKDDLGRVAVGGAPGFTPGQARAAQGEPFVLAESDEATRSFAREIPKLFTAWAESDEVGLNRYLAPNADTVTRTGLGNTVQYQDYRNLVVQEVEDPLGSRYATVDIIWSMGGNLVTQQYLLVIYERQEGEEKLWFVISIRPSLTSLP